MDVKQLIRSALEEYTADLRRALDGLTVEERRYQPGPESNHIDFLVWHIARTEDTMVQWFARSAEPVWQRDRWHEKLGLPEQENGFGYSAQQVAALPGFNLDDLLAYADAVRLETLDFLDSLSEAALDVRPQPDQFPDYTIGGTLSHLMVDASQHVGQVAYLRGLQRGLGK